MRGKIDVVVGLQFGDEGKGSTCVMLEEALKGQNEHEYLFSVRVGGSQAEHRFVYDGKGYKFRVLPSLGAVKDMDLLLGAGHIIRPDILGWEIGNYGIDPEQVFVDKCAAVVNSSTKKQSRSNNSFGRAGYSMGISGTLCKKMKRKPGDKVIVDNIDWKYGKVGTVMEMVNDRLIAGQNGLLEGSQGALLSLNHGYYPYVTSYDVNTSSLLGMAGLHWEDVRDVYGVIKVFPSRVAGESGIMAGKSVSWKEIEQQAGQRISEYRKMQTWDDASFRGYERMTEFHQGEFRRALMLNRPTKLILTHTDWCSMAKVHKIIIMAEATALEVLGRKCPVVYLRYGEDIMDFSKTPEI